MPRSTAVSKSAARSRSKDPFELPLDTPPMEALSQPALPDDAAAWQYEPKWDGFRCLAFKFGANVDLRAKSGKPLGRYFPEALSLFRNMRLDRFVLDGELAIVADGKVSFDALQMRLHPAESRVRMLSETTPAQFVAFDILVAPGGKRVMDQPLTKRRPALEAFGRKAGTPDAQFVVSPKTRDLSQARRWLDDNRSGTDGVIAKRLDGLYEPGERAMVKVKRLRTADCVVGGFRYASGSREVGSLLLGLYDEAGKLNHVGFTSSIARADKADLTKRLERLREGPGFTGKAPGGPSRWSTERSGEWEPLKPSLVVEAGFDHVTGGRFRHGTKLIRWRPDKAPRQCKMEQLSR